MLLSHAATSFVSLEAENGTLSSGAVSMADTSASGGKSVQFGTSGGGGSASGGGQAGIGWLHLDSGTLTSTTLTTEAKRRKIIILNAWDYKYIPTLKAANPNLLVYAYKDLSSTRSYGCTNGVDDAELPTGVGYCYADKYHPEWFLTDAAGNRLMYSGYAGHVQMDIGNAAYQKQWADNVAADLKSHGFDGVEMDNALFACDDYHSGVCPKNYATNAAFQNAYVSMLKSVQPVLKSAGIQSIANMANARMYTGAWNAYLAYIDGGFDEFWVEFNPGNLLPDYGTSGWKAQVDEIASAAAAGKLSLVQPHTNYTDTAGFYYTLASYFMASDGKSMYLENTSPTSYNDPSPWRPTYDWNLGTPSGAYKSIGTHLYERVFSCGVAVVNADNSVTNTVTLPGSYLNESGATVTSVQLGPKSGSVLRGINCK